MIDRPPMQAIFAGMLAAFVGFASSFAVVVKGLTTVGASAAEAASGLTALSIAMGICAIWLSLRTRLPISIAWSTPGGALLASSGAVEGGFAAAVGAFIASSVLIVLAGLWKPLGRWVAAIPAPLANAMLAGVLLGLCLAPVRAVAADPLPALAVILAWAIVGRFHRLYAVPVAVMLTIAIVWLRVPAAPEQLASWWPAPVLIMPRFEPAAIVGIGIPLFIVTMASQNIPGMAVLAANGYRPDLNPLLRTTGLFSLAAAPFGGHAVNLAAITAALCAGESVHADPARRWWAAAIAGATYVIFGLLAGAATLMLSAASPVLIEAVAGLALLGAFGSALLGAVSAAEDREAAIITFIVTASGLTFFGIGGAFWGLLAGGAMMLLRSR